LDVFPQGFAPEHRAQQAFRSAQARFAQVSLPGAEVRLNRATTAFVQERQGLIFADINWRPRRDDLQRIVEVQRG
jgi:hypothetical protein